MGTYIQIDSISIDLSKYVENTEPGQCEHFSLRGYVSEMRKRDWKTCWPFPPNESEDQPPFPPLVVPNFRWWACQRCRQAIAAEGIDRDDEGIDRDERIGFNSSNNNGDGSTTNCGNADAVISSGIQQPPTDAVISSGIQAPADAVISSGIQQAPADAVISSGIQQAPTDAVISSGIQQAPTDAVISSGIQQAPMPDSTIARRDIDLNIPIELSSDGDCDIENNAEIAQSRITNTAIALENNYHQLSSVQSPEVNPSLVQEAKSAKQCQMELRESCAMLMEAAVVTPQDDVTEHSTEQLPAEPVGCSQALPMGTDKVVNNNCPEKFPGLSRKRPRKMRLMTDILSENGDQPKTASVARNGSAFHRPSNASATLQTLPDKVHAQGDMTLTKRGQGRKRKLLPDEESKRPADMCSQRSENEIQNPERETIDTASDNRSKDVLVGKRTRKIQHVDNHLISDPHQRELRGNGDTVFIANKECASRSVSSGFFPHAITEKRMDDFPLHGLRTDDVHNLSKGKGKGKMVQADEELDSLSCWKNDRLVEDSFAHTGAKNMSNMPVSVPIRSAQGASNGESLEEGLDLSLNCYSSTEVSNEKGIHQTENQFPSSLPFLEGTSKPQLIRNEGRTNTFKASRHITNDLSVKGKGVLEETNGARNKDKTAEIIELGGTKRFYDLTVEDSDQSTFDDVPMEVVEIMARNQYERSLPDVENISSLPEESTQMGKQPASYRKNGAIAIQENVLPQKGNSVNYFHPFTGNQFGVNNLCKTQSPFGFEVLQSKSKPSSGIFFSPRDTIKLVPAGTSNFNGSIAESGSADASLQAKGVYNLRPTTLQQNRGASHPWPTLAKTNASLGYNGIPRKAASQPSSRNTGMVSPRSGSLQNQIKKRDIDLNCPNINVENLQNLGRNIGYGTMTRADAEYRFRAKHNAIEARQNLRGSLDMNSNEAIPAMHLLSLVDADRQAATSLNAGVRAQMLKSPSYPGGCSTNVETNKSTVQGSQKRSASTVSSKSDGNLTKSGKREKPSSSNSSMQTGACKQLSLPHVERETAGTLNNNSGNLCTLNRNPGDFTELDECNSYMINPEDLIFEDSVPEEKLGIPASRGSKLKKNQKGKTKEHGKKD